MWRIRSIKLIMKYKIYKTYNDINSEFDVIVMPQTEFNKVKDQLNNPKIVICTGKTKHPNEPSTKELLLNLLKELKEFKSFVLNVFEIINAK